MSAAPATLARISDRKGSIAAGMDADFVIWNPDEEFLVEPNRLEQRHKVTPYAGMRLCGRVHDTWLRGPPVWKRGQPVGAPAGRLL